MSSLPPLSFDPKRRLGQVVAGRYELVELIGAGGQGSVYRANDRQDGDTVAIKILASRDPDAVERMFREAQIMSQLRNTAAVHVLHQVRTGDGALGLVMELLHGVDLTIALERREAAGVRADRAFVVRLFEPIVATLEAAHEHGIVHRDMKTSNVFVLDDARGGGGVRLLDFGFAKLLRAPAITAAEMVAGSPSYLAPEVWLRGSSYADPLVDVYGLGVVLFRVLGGRLPFEGTMHELMQAATTARRPSLRALRPDLRESVDAWVEHVLAIEPSVRFQRPAAAWRALLACFE
jgi:serine/threonine-protein kinase